MLYKDDGKPLRRLVLMCKYKENEKKKKQEGIRKKESTVLLKERESGATGEMEKVR